MVQKHDIHLSGHCVGELMDKYIDCEAAYRFAQDQLKKETGAYSRGWNHALGVMKGALHNNDAIPAADVAPVRHGRWIVSRIDYSWLGTEYPTHCKCDQCGREIPYLVMDDYCPRCGARMDGDANG